MDYRGYRSYRYRRPAPVPRGGLPWKFEAGFGALLSLILATWIGKLVVGLVVVVLVVKLVVTLALAFVAVGALLFAWWAFTRR